MVKFIHIFTGMTPEDIMIKYDCDAEKIAASI